LIVNDRVFPLFLELLQHPDAQDKALGCILEVVSKGMNEASKVALLKHINVVSIMDYFQPVRMHSPVSPLFFSLSSSHLRS
jgi:hypothetical protein